MLEIVHDATQGPRGTPLSVGRVIFEQRGLVMLLCRRDLSARYKRSVLGVWWTLLNPLLECAVLWIVFSQVFRFSTPHAPYAVYLISGVILATLFRQTVTGVATSLVNNAAILGRIHAPAEVFACSAALVQAVNFAVSMIPLLAIMLVAGVTPPATFLLALAPAALLLAFSAGIGLMLAPATVTYPDVHELLRIGLTLVAYLAPIFYPFDIVPDRYRALVHANPLFHFLEGFRSLLYVGDAGPAASWAVMLGASALALWGGIAVFSRSARIVIARL